MKKVTTYFTILAIALLWSCNDAIDIEQPGRLGAENAFRSVSDLRSGLLGAYDEMDLSSEIQFNAIFTDELAIGFDNGGQGIGVAGGYDFILNPTASAAAAIWNINYDMINAANRIIEATDIVPVEAGEQGEFNDVLGQALAIRAYAHFNLISYYSTSYTDDSALGPMLVDFVPGIDAELPRSTNGEVYALITSDLERAESLIAEEQNATFLSKDFVRALQARIATYREQYAQADALAEDLLTRYPIANRAEYEGIFLDADNTEIIFKLERSIGDNHDRQAPTGSGFGAGWVGANFAFVNATLAGSPYFEMGRAVFNLLDPDDIRFTVNVAPTSLIDPDYQTNQDRALDILVIQKYPGSDGQPLLNDQKAFRASEMLLIRAEAAAAAGNFNGASNSTAAFIKQLRDARFGTAQPLPNYASQQAAFAAVLDERRIELVFEGHRWKDLKRLGARANQGASRDAIDCAFNGACSLPATDFRFTMPIPLFELNANNNIQQNPGY